jgi:hypothetical protein
MKIGADSKVVPFVSVEAPEPKPEKQGLVDTKAARMSNPFFADEIYLHEKSYYTSYAGAGSSERHWDILLTELRLFQDADLLAGDWLNLGGFYNRQKGIWFSSAADFRGTDVDTLRAMVLGYCIKHGLTIDALDEFVTRKGRSIEDEKKFFALSLTEQMDVIRGSNV